MIPLLCGIFFISGVSALVFETLWFHQAGLGFGNSVWASSLVLSGFMGGLALGSAVAVRRGDRLGPPIRTYAALEIVIAISGVSLVLTLPALGTLATPILRPFFEVPWILNPLRLLFAFSLLLVPSTAMGLTLPLLTKALVAADPNFGRALGRLYGWNTLGAVVGAVLAEILLLEALGVRGSAVAAGTLNLLAAAAAMLLTKSFRRHGSATEEPHAGVFEWTGGARWLGAAFLSGFALLALEVVWFRFLQLYVIGTSLSFSVMLAVVLGGISSGGLFASAWLRRDTDAHRHATAVALAAGVVCTATYGLFPYAVGHFGHRAIFGVFNVLTVSVPLMFPVSFLSGIFFTLVGTALRKSCPSAATTTGLVTLANTTGATLGAIAGGFLLLPLAGVEASFFLLSIVYGATALLIFDREAIRTRRAYPAIGVYVLSLALFPAGSMGKHHLFNAAARWGATTGWQVVDVREGLSETIIYVEEMTFGKPEYFRLVTNSLSMSSTRFNARRYMKLFAYLPVAVHPDLKRALLISYGVGSTAKALTETASFEEIDVVDISRDILEMNSIVFPDSTDNPLHDPRVRIHIEDGRYFLQTTDKSFDLITGEPPPPDIAGVVNLYTQEYFQLIYERLNDGGIVTYWLPLHSLSDKAAKAIIRAFGNVFSDASLWHGWREDVMLVGTRGSERDPVSVEWFERQWQQPHIVAEMKNLGLERPEQLGALFIGDSEYLKELTRNVLPLVDNFPKRIVADSVLGQNRSRLFASLADADAARARFPESRLIQRLWPEPLIERSVPYFDFQRIINDLIGLSGNPLSRNLVDLHFVITRSALTGPALWHMGSSPDVQAIIADLSPEEQALPLWQYQIAAGLFSERRYVEAAEGLRKAEEHTALFAMARLFRVYSLCLLQQVDAAERLAQQAYPALAQQPGLEHWWNFLNGEFGIEPRQ